MAIACIYWLLSKPHATHSDAVNHPQIKNNRKKVQLAFKNAPFSKIHREKCEMNVCSAAISHSVVHFLFCFRVVCIGVFISRANFSNIFLFRFHFDFNIFTPKAQPALYSEIFEF